MITEEQVKNAWMHWQSEESRDRGYDFNLCIELRRKYYDLYKEYKEQGDEVQSNTDER